MSKDLFMMLREEEVATSQYFPTKKDLVKSAKEFSEKLIESGEHNLQEVYAQSLRLKEALSTIESELKSHLPEENFEAFGLKATYRNGGNTTNFKDDPKWVELSNKLKDREELLKTALKSDAEFYDEQGEKVDKVSLTPRKSALAISF